MVEASEAARPLWSKLAAGGGTSGRRSRLARWEWLEVVEVTGGQVEMARGVGRKVLMRRRGDAGDTRARSSRSTRLAQTTPTSCIGKKGEAPHGGPRLGHQGSRREQLVRNYTCRKDSYAQVRGAQNQERVTGWKRTQVVGYDGTVERRETCKKSCWKGGPEGGF